MLLLKQIDKSQIRFCVGYSGWGSHQLETELRRNSWLVSKLPAKVLMATDPDELWDYALQQLGEEYTYWSNFPKDPGLN
jgi:putative transcriptional regulator